MDRDNISRAERRSALIVKKLIRYNINIAALSALKKDQCDQSGSGCTFFWKGKAQNEDRIHGIGFTIF